MSSASPFQSDRALTGLLSAAWCEVLGVDQPSEFFEQGGDSLDGLELLEAIHAATGVEIPQYVLTENPTFEAFIDAVRVLPDSSVPASWPSAGRGLSLQQGGLAAIDRRVGLDGYGHVAWTDLAGVLSERKLPDVLADLDRHDALASAIVIADSPALARAPFPYGEASVELLLTQSGEKRRVLARSHQFHLDEPSVDLLLSLVVVGLRGEKDLVPRPGHDYSDYVRLQRAGQRLEAATLRHEEARLARVPRPSGNAISPDDSDSWRPVLRRTVALPLSSEQLDNAARRVGVTPFSLLVAAFGHAVGQASSNEAFLLCCSTRNRPPGFAMTLGCFASAEVIVVEPDPGISPQAAARNVMREQSLARRCELPMDYLLERLDRPGCCQLKFSYERDLSRPQWPGGTCQINRDPPSIVRRDLSFSVGGDLQALVGWSADRLDEMVVGRIVESWKAWLRQLLS